MKEFLYTLLRSLEQIKVSGKDNLEILIGCIYAAEQMISEIEADEQTPGPIINEDETGPIINEERVTDDG